MQSKRNFNEQLESATCLIGAPRTEISLNEIYFIPRHSWHVLK